MNPTQDSTAAREAFHAYVAKRSRSSIARVLDHVDTAELRAFVRAHHRSGARGHVGASDILQDGWLRVYDIMARSGGALDFAALADVRRYFMRVLRNLSYAAARRASRQLSTDESAAVLDATVDTRTSPDEQRTDTQPMRARQCWLDAQPKRTRRIVELRDAELSWREIGQRVGLSDDAAQKVHERARRSLARALRASLDT